MILINKEELYPMKVAEAQQAKIYIKSKNYSPLWSDPTDMVPNAQKKNSTRLHLTLKIIAVLYEL